MVIKSRARFGASRELAALDPGRGEIRESRSKSPVSVLDFGSWPGHVRVMSRSGSCLGHVRVMSRSLGGQRLDFEFEVLESVWSRCSLSDRCSLTDTDT